MQLSFNVWIIPREAFCWLNETKVIVKSTDRTALKRHCELVDIVSKLFEN